MQDRVLKLQKQGMNIALMRRVAEVLMSYEPELFRSIDLDARGKVVILKGRIVGEDGQKRALELARCTAGVEEVVDCLTVIPRARPEPVIDTIQAPRKEDSAWSRALVLVSLLAVISSAVISMVKEPGEFATEEVPAVAVVQEEKAPVYAVEGTLFVEGKPAEGARVVFHPVAGEKPCLASAIVGPNGRFSLKTVDNRDGATAGKFAVTVAWYRPIPPGEEISPEEAGSLVPRRFQRVHTTPLRINITPPLESPTASIQLPPIHVMKPGGVRRT
ncbi:MAG: BON domain-containing protein [Planctomycetia bacterium]|nr:BON domain-containing protein [Planctomycetia bacterium]